MRFAVGVQDLDRALLRLTHTELTHLLVVVGTVLDHEHPPTQLVAILLQDLETILFRSVLCSSLSSAIGMPEILISPSSSAPTVSTEIAPAGKLTPSLGVQHIVHFMGDAF